MSSPVVEFAFVFCNLTTASYIPTGFTLEDLKKLFDLGWQKANEKL